MKKVIKIGFPIVCVSVIGVTFYLLDNAQKRVNSLKNNTNSSVVAENKVSNSEDEKNEIIESENKITYSVSVEDEENKKLEEEKRQVKAIEVVKDIYGGSDNVYYTNEGIEEGRYIVAVRNKETTTAVIYYIVDVLEEKAEVYY